MAQVNQRLAAIASRDPDVYEVIAALQGQVDALQKTLSAVETRLAAAEAMTTKPVAATQRMVTTGGYDAHPITAQPL